MLGQFRKWGVNSQDKLLVKSIWTVFHGLLASWKAIACENTMFQEILFSAFNFEQESLKVNNFYLIKMVVMEVNQKALNVCAWKENGKRGNHMGIDLQIYALYYPHTLLLDWVWDTF